MIDDTKTLIYAVQGNIARGAIIESDLTLSPCYVARVGNSFAHGKTVKDAFADAQAKEVKKTPIKKRLEMFKKKYPLLDSTAKGQDLFDWHNILTGSCRMGREAFCREHGVLLQEKYTIGYFLDLTENAYGGSVIKQLKQLYNGNSIENY